MQLENGDDEACSTSSFRWVSLVSSVFAVSSLWAHFAYGVEDANRELMVRAHQCKVFRGVGDYDSDPVHGSSVRRRYTVLTPNSRAVHGPTAKPGITVSSIGFSHSCIQRDQVLRKHSYPRELSVARDCSQGMRTR